MVHFSHRLLHWGSSGDARARACKGGSEGDGDGDESGSEPRRVALSFASADDAFEAPYFSRAHLPLPPVPLRAALVAGLALAYVANEDCGAWRGKLYWDAFRAGHAGCGGFSDGFAQMVARNWAAQQSKWA